VALLPFLECFRRLSRAQSPELRVYVLSRKGNQRKDWNCKRGPILRVRLKSDLGGRTAK